MEVVMPGRSNLLIPDFDGTVYTVVVTDDPEEEVYPMDSEPEEIVP